MNAMIKWDFFLNNLKLELRHMAAKVRSQFCREISQFDRIPLECEFRKFH